MKSTLEKESNSYDKFDINNFLRTYTRNWKWFLLSILASLVLAYLFIRYTPSQYAAQAKILLLDDRNASSELGVFQDLEVFSGGNTSRVQDEIEVIKSRSNFIEIVKKLELNVSTFEVGNILSSELYKSSPFKINFIEPDSVIYNSSTTLFVKVNDATSFELAMNIEAPFKKYSFGERISTQLGDMVFLPSDNQGISKLKGKEYQININKVESIADFYRNSISIVPTDKSSNIVSFYLEDPIQKRAQDIINSLISIYNQNTIDDKKRVADRTSEFINDRIANIHSNLSEVDQTAEDFKTDKGITDIASEANINLNAGVSTNQELQNATLQLNIASSMKDVVDGQDGYEILPSNIGLSDPSITNTTLKYNELVAERNRLLKSSNEKNPIIVNLDQQLEGLKRNMKSSLNSMTNNLELQVNSLSTQRSRINSRIYSAPRNERALRDITRQQQTTESLYLYLLEKREESQIAFASSSPKSQIIDMAYSSSRAPVYPQKRIIYFGALFLGFLIPFSIIYLIDLLDNKVHNKLDLEKLSGNVPVLVEVPKMGKKDNKLVKKEDRSVLAESLRILRTNLNYIQRSHKSTPNNLIFITSSVPGEGKTFISSNLAKIYADTGKKVLLLGADIRNPKLYDFFSSDENVEVGKGTQPRRSTKAGLTEFLVNSDLKVQDITVPAHINENEIDLIFSGKIPPNPTELLMNPRMGELFEKVSKMYDYVIVDTAPLMVVTDTLLISEYASQILYVVKAGATELKVIDFPLKLKEEGKLKGLSFVVNNVKQSELGYGGKYGYGYGKSVKKWWNFS